MKRFAMCCAAALLGSSSLGCAALLRPDFVEDVTDDAAILTIVQAPREFNYLSGVPDPVKCEGAVNLAGSARLEGERKVRLPPSQEFAFAVALSRDLGFVSYWCQQMVIFTPEPRTEYRATVQGTAQTRCGIRLTKVIAGVEIEDLSARRRRMSQWSGCVD